VDELFILKEKKILKRAFIFWDHVSIFQVLQELNIRFDYHLVKSRLSRGYDLVSPIMYFGKKKAEFSINQKVLDSLVKQGWFIIETPLKTKSSRNESQNETDDIMLLDIYDFAKEGAYEKAIIVSGDNDFVEIVKELKKMDIDVEVWSFRISISERLINELNSENVYYFDDFMEEITILDYSQDEELK